MKFEPLKGIRVLDLTSVVVGPVATWRLGQYGAEVIKVESPAGDLMRELGGKSPSGKHSGTYLHLNRGKKNICIDLKQNGSKEVMERLVQSADVIVANMRPQALERLGLDANEVRRKYPDKIYCLLSGYGTNGPYSGFPTYDSVIQGAAGIAGLTLTRDGVPSYVPMLICDHVVGEIASSAIMAAVIERYKTNQGTYLEVPMFETMAAFVMQEHLAQESFQPPVGPPGDLRLLSPHNKPVQTKDGYISFTINTDKQVRAFLKVTERQELIDDDRFCSVAARAEHVGEWFKVRGAPLTEKTTDEWISIFRKADIAVMPCHTISSLKNDPHLCAVRLVDYEEHPTEGKSAVIRSSIRVNEGYLSPGSPSAPLGWNSKEILEEVGFKPAEISRLFESDVVR